MRIEAEGSQPGVPFTHVGAGEVFRTQSGEFYMRLFSEHSENAVNLRNGIPGSFSPEAEVKLIKNAVLKIPPSTQ